MYCEELLRNIVQSVLSKKFIFWDFLFIHFFFKKTKEQKKKRHLLRRAVLPRLWRYGFLRWIYTPSYNGVTKITHLQANNASGCWSVIFGKWHWRAMGYKLSLSFSLYTQFHLHKHKMAKAPSSIVFSVKQQQRNVQQTTESFMPKYTGLVWMGDDLNNGWDANMGKCCTAYMGIYLLH